MEGWFLFFDYLSLFFGYYFLVINSFYALLIILSIPSIYKRFREVESENVQFLVKSESLPSIAIIVPVYNMGTLGIQTVYNVLRVRYPSKEIIIVDDGSTDNTLELLQNEFDLEETFSILPQHLKTKPIRKVYRSKKFTQLKVIDKENGGKSDANNVGINVSSAQFFLIIDGDTVLESDALLRMIRPFFTDATAVAQGGTLRVLNGCKVVDGKIERVELPKKPLAAIQVVEYLRSFLYGRLGWNRLGGNLIVSGAFGLFEKNPVIKVGGFETKSIGEDFEMTLRLAKYQRNRTKCRGIGFIPDPVAWTEVPDSLKTLGKQRARWHQGLMDVLNRYKSMIFNPQYGMTGMIGVPYMWIGELLEPVIEIIGYVTLILGVSLGFLSWKRFVVVFLVAFGVSIIVTIIAIILEITTFRRYNLFRQLLRMFSMTFFENLGYRQLYLWWRMRGIMRYFLKKKDW